MFAGYDEGQIDQRTPEADDVAAACAAYPQGRRGVCDPTPRNGFGRECAGAVTTGGGAADAPAAGCAAAETRGRDGAAGLLGVGLALAMTMARRRRTR